MIITTFAGKIAAFMTVPPVAIVTGAGSGIGAEVCQMLAADGYRITLVGRSESKLQRTMDAIVEQMAAAPEMLVEPADISDAEQARSLVDLTIAQWGRVDVIVNNAGFAALSPLEESSEDLLFQSFAINTFGPFYLVARAWPALRRQRSGCIVNVSSMATLDPFPGLGVYAAAKAALESLTRSIHQEGSDLGIRAFSVAPGAVETPMLRHLFSEEALPPEKTLDPAEVASVVLECIRGIRDDQRGGVIRVPSP